MNSKFVKVGISAFVYNPLKQAVLLIAREKNPHAGMWCLPGGSLEFCEKLPEAMAREVHEETGYRVKPMLSSHDFVTTELIMPEEHQHYLIVTGMFQPVSQTPDVTEESLTIPRKWVSLSPSSDVDYAFDFLNKENSVPNLVRILKQLHTTINLQK